MFTTDDEPTCLENLMSLKIRKEKRGWLFADGRQTQMSRHRCKGATQEHLTSKNACNERKVESRGWIQIV